MNVSLAIKDGVGVVEDLSASPLSLRGLTVSYGDKPAVFSVDMTLNAG